MGKQTEKTIDLRAPEAYINRELSWLSFARRVLSFVEDPEVPLLERIKFAGIMGMLHDEFFMKRISGLKRQIRRGVNKVSLDGRTPVIELRDCRKVILEQASTLAKVLNKNIRPALLDAGIPILDWSDLNNKHKSLLKKYFKHSVMPILTPLAVDAEHPFPFISNLGLNLAIELKKPDRERFIRIKVPANRDRWVPLNDGAGFIPLEQVIAANLDLLFPQESKLKAFFFRLTRGAKGDDDAGLSLDVTNGELIPGSIISQVTNELKARRFAGPVRLQVAANMPVDMRHWLTSQLETEPEDIYDNEELLGIAELLKFKVQGRPELRDLPHKPVTHPRLRKLNSMDSDSIFQEIRRGDILLHHPYYSFNTSVLHFLEAAAVDPKVLAIKLTIYRTSSDSPII
ncbi:RNA degradosome polyphosphate kinase, partial [Acidobacteriota bacterium]